MICKECKVLIQDSWYVDLSWAYGVSPSALFISIFHTVQMARLQLDALLINLCALIVGVTHFILLSCSCPPHRFLLIRRYCIPHVSITEKQSRKTRQSIYNHAQVSVPFLHTYISGSLNVQEHTFSWAKNGNNAIFYITKWGFANV